MVFTPRSRSHDATVMFGDVSTACLFCNRLFVGLLFPQKCGFGGSVLPFLKISSLPWFGAEVGVLWHQYFKGPALGQGGPLVGENHAFDLFGKGAIAASVFSSRV